MEKSKTFKFLGTMVGIKVEKKSQRGIVGKLFKKYRDQELEKGLFQIKPNTRGLKVIDGGEVGYI